MDDELWHRQHIDNRFVNDYNNQDFSLWMIINSYDYRIRQHASNWINNQSPVFPLRGGNMKTKVLWLVITCLMVLAMVLASCGKAPTSPSQTVVTGTAIQPTGTIAPTTTNAPVITTATTSTTVTTTSVATTPTTAPGTPKYGGSFTGVFDTATAGFDDVYSRPATSYTTVITNEAMVGGDWAKGLAGSGETDWAWQYDNPKFVKGFLAESWSIPDPSTIIFKIRQGVHFALNPASEASRLVNGRELTADDVAFSFTRVLTTPTSNQGGSYGKWFKSATANDKYTVTLKVDEASGTRTAVAFQSISSMIRIWPKDLIQKYGNATDWKNVVGTGGFMLTDYVSGSSFTMKKNPNYWQTDPVGPGKGNQLPYLDTVTWLDVYDTSTRMAALRTGKVDLMMNVAWEDASSAFKTNPELKYVKILFSKVFIVNFRVDKTDIPLYDLKVRQALCMAVDRKTLAATYYGGAPEINSYPVANTPEFRSVFTPVDKLPDAAKMTFEYSVDKAKALLAQTKWPSGFKTSVITASYTSWVEPLELLKNYWSKIGVDLQIQPMEYSAFLSIYNAIKAPEMIVYSLPAIAIPYKMYWALPGDDTNNSNLNDPKLMQIRSEMWSFENIANLAKRDQLLIDASQYWLSLAPAFVFPTPYVYAIWQPWVNNYHGEYSVGFGHYNIFVNYLWTDQTLKNQTQSKR
jgi:peptide/nickel transport system substrate-binding protein